MAKARYPWIVEKLWPLATPVEQLTTDPVNARTHNPANLAAIEASLKRFGQVTPLVANSRNNQVADGAVAQPLRLHFRRHLHHLSFCLPS